MEKQHVNDEIDLGLVFRKIGDIWRGFLVWVYRFIQFLKRNWAVLLVLIIVGCGIGYYLKETQAGGYQSVLIIQNNFGSSNYVYDAFDKLKSLERQKWFREKYGFDSENATITEIDIEPIISIVDLIASTEDDGRVLEQYLSEADFQDDLLMSDAFINEYQYHRVTIDFNKEASSNVFEAIFKYLNDNTYFKEAQKIGIEESKRQIISYEKSIEGIDAVFFSFKDPKIVGRGSQFSFLSKETTNLHFLIDEKRKLLDKITFLKTNLLKLNDVVYVVNNKGLSYRMTFLDRLHILLPLFLVFLFFILSYLKKLYKRVANYAELKK